MENATKGLLIAAGILITIVVITLGILLTKKLKNTSDQADKTGQLLSNTTDKELVNVSGELKGIIISREKFNNMLEDFKKYKNAQEVNAEIIQNSSKLKDQIELIGYVYTDSLSNFYMNENISVADIDVKNNSKIINSILPNSHFTKIINNPFDYENVLKEIKEVYVKKTEKDENTFDQYIDKYTEKSFKKKRPIGYNYFYEYDKTGYISKVCIMSGIILDNNILNSI